ncbi:unnamed protein product [Owenia fusiformis]|uniref:Ribosyldihydronicotinamide dehydrogenase [quinone] n=1 Tax=Owenia fusiformis TaxID=6347 RepID=A0A8J1TJU1_OWEFU|nr:unnamed protein product [Owenia fusiformis]
MSFQIQNGSAEGQAIYTEEPITPGSAKSLVNTFESWNFVTKTERQRDIPNEREFDTKDVKAVFQNGVQSPLSPGREKPGTGKIPARTLVQAFESGDLVDTAERKNILMVYAHEEPKSFNGSMKDLAVQALKRQGHNVEVSDLYEMNFEPRTTKKDIKGNPKDKDYFKYPVEAGIAFANDNLSDDIKAEQDKVRAANLIIFQFPIAWGSFPAIMKGWLDRVLCYGFAYGDGKFMDASPLNGKKVLLSFTTGCPAEFYTNTGLLGDMDILLWPMQNNLRFCGFDILAPQIVYAPAHCEEKDRDAIIEAWQTRLKGLIKEKPVRFIPLEDFDKNKMYQLSDTFFEKPIAKGKYGPTVGQHDGKPIPIKGMREAW